MSRVILPDRYPKKTATMAVRISEEKSACWLQLPTKRDFGNFEAVSRSSIPGTRFLEQMASDDGPA